MLEDAFRFELLTPPAFDDRSLARSLAPCAPYLLFDIVIITSVVFSLTLLLTDDAASFLSPLLFRR